MTWISRDNQMKWRDTSGDGKVWDSPDKKQEYDPETWDPVVAPGEAVVIPVEKPKAEPKPQRLEDMSVGRLRKMAGVKEKKGITKAMLIEVIKNGTPLAVAKQMFKKEK